MAKPNKSQKQNRNQESGWQKFKKNKVFWSWFGIFMIAVAAALATWGIVQFFTRETNEGIDIYIVIVYFLWLGIAMPYLLWSLIKNLRK